LRVVRVEIKRVFEIKGGERYVSQDGQGECITWTREYGSRERVKGNQGKAFPSKKEKTSLAQLLKTLEVQQSNRVEERRSEKVEVANEMRVDHDRERTG